MNAKKYGSRILTKGLHSRTKARLQLLKIAVMLLLFLLLVATTRAQSPLDGFNPNADGPVYAFVVQPDGKILVGGSFATLSPNGGAAVTRSRIARLNPDGTLDAAFNPNATGTFSFVTAIALQPDGKILVGGVFDNIGGQPRNNIARLDPVTGLADSFNPNANANIRSIVVQADGKILVGGGFEGANSIGGQTRNGIARLDSVTGLADSFNPNCSGEVYTILVLPSGKILVGGFFLNIGAQVRSHIARLDAVTGLADAFDPHASREVITMALQNDGKILVGGHFTDFGGLGRKYIARLDPTTGLPDSFNPNANEEVDSIVVQADGKILVGGFFRGANSIGGQTRNCMARIDPTTGLADSFDPNGGGGIPGNNAVFSIALQGDGKILAGGNFTTLSPNGGTAVTRNRIARLETDGRLDQALDTGLTGNEVDATTILPDGKMLIGGYFLTVSGVSRSMIARLNTDGTLDSAFNASANGNVYAIAAQPDGKVVVGGQFSGMGGQPRSNIARLDATGLADSLNANVFGTVYSIVVQPDGRILAGGSFTSVGGQSRRNIFRLNQDGTLDASFNPSADNTVIAITLQPDGKILVGGLFAGIGGEARNRLARLDATTGLADSFDPNGNDFVSAVVVQEDGKILVSGEFTQIGGQPRIRFARLDPTTALADSFNPNADHQVRSIALQTDGKILVGGFFTTIGGQLRNRIARLDPVTGLADSFNPTANGNVYGVALQADGKILVGGQFSSIGGQPRNRFARLTNDVPAFQNLAVTQTTVTWTRSGSSTQFTRVTFEYSTDNVNFTPLGNGAATGGNWTLTGLSLPTGFRLFIRARGYYLCGSVNGSGSIAEITREIFLPGPITTPTPTPTPTATPTPTPTPGTCAWSAAPVAPVPLKGEAVTSLGGSLYSFGGTSSNVVIATSYKFDGTLWSTIAPLPVALTGATAVNDGTFIYVLGGSDSNGALPATLYRYNPIANSYTTLASFPTATTGQAAAYLGGKIYKFCGLTSNLPTGALEIYDIAANQWTAGASCPLAAAYVSTFVQGNFIYSAGGLIMPLLMPSIPTTKTYRYDPVTNAWDDAAIADLPITRYWAASAFHNGGGVLAGGIVAGGNISASAISWDPVSNTWSNLPNMLVERSNMSGAVLGGSFYVVGGSFTALPGGSSNDNQELACQALPTPTPPPTPTPTPTPSASPTPTATPGTLGNISTRLRVLSGDNALIGGMIATGTAEKRVIIRAIGPSLIPFGIPGALANPTLDLFQGSTLLFSNDDWNTSTQQAEIANSGLAPSHNLESAIVWALAPGQNYTAVVRGQNGGTGVGIVEAYDLDQAAASKLGNISTRGFVDVDDNVMIAGLIAGPGNGTSLKVLIRALGPTLSDFGVAGALTNPTLDLVNSSGTVIRSNDNWKDDPQQRAAIEAAGLAPSHDEEAALVETVAPGAYTAVVRGSNRAIGVGLVEAYNIP